MYLIINNIIASFPRILTAVVQFGCVSHCFLEYVADLAIVSIFLNIILYFSNFFFWFIDT